MSVGGLEELGSIGAKYEWREGHLVFYGGETGEVSANAKLISQSAD